MKASSPRPKTATFVQVLEYMDGPQAVLLEKSLDAKIVGVAIHDDSMQYPFFGAEISRDQWERYKRGFVDFRFLFMFPKYKSWYKFDLMPGPKDRIALKEVQKDEHADENYVPDSSFFSYDHSEPILTTAGGLAIQSYNTDGIWDFPDFSQFYNKVTDLYVFFLSLNKYDLPDTRIDLKKKIHDAFAGQPFRGGSSYVNLYNGLLSVQEIRDKLAIGQLRYSSPGIIDVRGQFEVFAGSCPQRV
jgi:hypothetical protein